MKNLVARTSEENRSGGGALSPRPFYHRGAGIWLSLLTFALMLSSGILAVSGCSQQGAPPDDGNLDKLEPKILTPESVDWGEINLLTTVTKEIVIQNEGQSKLSIASVSLAVGDAAGSQANRFTIVAQPEGSVAIGESTRMRVRAEGYTEASVMTDTLIIESDDPDRPRLEIPLQAAVVRPEISVFPTALNFNEVTTGASQAQTLSIQNSGKGTLGIYDLTFDGDTDGEFSYSFRSGFQLGQTLSAGTGIVVDITYAPKDDGQDNVTLKITSGDPETKIFEVPVSGNGKVNLPPEIRIIQPATGDTFYVGSTITLQGQLVDNVDPYDKIAIFLFSDIEGVLCPNVKANESGFFSCTVNLTQAGNQRITATALDPNNQTSTPVYVDIIVWDQETELSYVISGSDQTSLYAFTPDDNLQVFVVDQANPEAEGTICVNAVDDKKEPESPRTCSAKYGDFLRIRVYDRYGFGYSIPKLHLWYGRNDEWDQPLIEETISAQEGQPGYNPDNVSCLPTPTRDEWYSSHPEDEPPPDCQVFEAVVQIQIPPPETTTPTSRPFYVP